MRSAGRIPLDSCTPTLVKDLQAAGRTGQAIINETGIGRASVRKWLRLRELPTRNGCRRNAVGSLPHRASRAGVLNRAGE
jgi:hypothetical protein